MQSHNFDNNPTKINTKANKCHYMHGPIRHFQVVHVPIMTRHNIGNVFITSTIPSSTQ